MRKQSAILRILLHAFFLISVNLFSVMVAVLIMHFMKIEADELIKSGMALVVNLIIYLLIYKMMNSVQPVVMQIDDFSMLAIMLMTSLALFPAIFYPLHFLTKNEWSAFENILKIWPFQLITNGLCLVANYFLVSKRG